MPREGDGAPVLRDLEARIASLEAALRDKDALEARLREIEERFALVLRASDDGWWDWDLSTGQIRLSPRWWEIHGYRADEMPSTPGVWKALTHVDDQEQVRRAYDEARDSAAGRFDVESRRLHKDGHWVPVRTRGYITRDASGNPVRVSGTTTDLTERKRADEALRASEALQNSVIDQSPHPMWISDSDGTLIRLNEACRRLLNLRDEDVVGKYNVLRDSIVAEQGFLPLVRRVFAAGETARFELRYESAELRGLPPARTARAIFDVTIFPVLDADGSVAHAVIQHIDITERRRAEDALRESEQLFRSMVETTIVGVWVLDGEGRTTFVNRRAAEMLGYEPAEMIGQPAVDFIFPDDLAEHRETMARRHAGQQETYERRFSRKDGQAIWAIVNATPIMTPGGAFGGAFATLTEITERMEAEGRLRALAEMLDAAPSAVTVYNSEGRFLYANRRTFELHGYDEREFMALNLRDVDVPESAALINDRMERAAREGEATFEVAHFRKDGTTVPLQVFARQVEWAGKPALLSIATDITDRKQAEEALSQQVDELRRWYAATLGREKRIAELKGEVNDLAGRLGIARPYAAAADGEPSEDT